MPPRASWKGQLKLSLIAIPVRLHNATASTARVTLNQLHKDCHHRLKQKMVCPEHGDVERADIVKGYEYEKGKYVVVEESDLEKLNLETTKIVEIVQFADANELDPIYWNSPYYVAPDGPVADEAFRVIREAMDKAHKIGIGRVVMANKEHLVALKVEDAGFLLTTLRYAAEVRSPTAYFEDIQDGPIPKDQLKLAEQLIESKTAPLDTSQFTDRYQNALLDIIKAKIEGTEPVIVQQAEAGKVVNFMEALKKSVEKAGKAKTKKKPPAKSVRKAAAKKKKAKGA